MRHSSVTNRSTKKSTGNNLCSVPFPFSRVKQVRESAALPEFTKAMKINDVCLSKLFIYERKKSLLYFFGVECGTVNAAPRNVLKNNENQTCPSPLRRP